MYNANKSLHLTFVSVFLSLFFLAGFASPVVADENYGNLPPDPNMMGMSLLESIDLPFDPNDYTFLIYEPKGYQDSIKQAMEEILGRPLNQSEIRSYTNPVTSSDLATHDILIVGWNWYGNTSGLDDETLAGIVF